MGNSNEKNENFTTKGIEIKKTLNLKYKELNNIINYFDSIKLENSNYFIDNITYLKTTLINTNEHEKIPKKLFLNLIKSFINISNLEKKEKIFQIFNNEYFLNEGMFNLDKIINLLLLISEDKIIDINVKNNEKISSKAFYIFNLFLKEGELNNLNILKEDFILFFSEEISFIAFNILLENYLNYNEKNHNVNDNNNENEFDLLKKILEMKSTIIDNIVMEYFNDENNKIDLDYINKLFEKNKNFMTLEFFLEKGLDNVKNEKNKI